MATGTIKKNIVKLWENPNPSADFVAQTVPLELSGYDWIAIKMHTAFDTGNITQIAKKGETTILNGCYTHMFWRRVAVSDSGCVFENALYAPNYASANRLTANNYLNPLEIYGIRA